MKKLIQIGDYIINYDNKKTSEIYSKEINIKEDCPCSECHFFVDVITKLELEIFQILKKVGTDLEKNLSSEPTGVWCIRDDNNEFIFFQQTYLIKGFILEHTSFHYEKEELGLRINAYFTNEIDDIIIDLQVSKMNVT
ncbi:hypothetical protein [Chishuiella sp.]|uniref:hypothetical protein n=1 Tax=Chishuiella sp. TaxID=1969467 RepID=UPI0028AD4036|nr:hypothetical protein [Chishuiella sp.]